MCSYFILSGPHTSLHICNHIQLSIIKICNIILRKWGGGGRRPLGFFPKIHPIWYRHPSLKWFWPTQQFQLFWSPFPKYTIHNRQEIFLPANCSVKGHRPWYFKILDVAFYSYVNSGNAPLLDYKSSKAQSWFLNSLEPIRLILRILIAKTAVSAKTFTIAEGNTCSCRVGRWNWLINQKIPSTQPQQFDKQAT